MQFFVDVVKASLDSIVVLKTLVVREECTRGGVLIVNIVVRGRFTDVTVTRYVTLIVIRSATVSVFRTNERGNNCGSLQAWMGLPDVM